LFSIDLKNQLLVIREYFFFLIIYIVYCITVHIINLKLYNLYTVLCLHLQHTIYMYVTSAYTIQINLQNLYLNFKEKNFLKRIIQRIKDQYSIHASSFIIIYFLGLSFCMTSQVVQVMIVTDHLTLASHIYLRFVTIILIMRSN
jgi:hypothetical protein